MNSLYGEVLRKDISESYHCKSEMWMQTEYDERVLDYQKTNYGNYIVKMKDDEGLEDEVEKSQHITFTISCLHSIKQQTNYERFYTCYRWILHK